MWVSSLLSVKVLFAALAAVLTFSILTATAYSKGKAYVENQVMEARLEAERDASILRDELTTRHIAKLRTLRNENAKLQKQLDATIVDNPTCDLGPDAIMLINQARGVSETASLDAAADAAPATHLSQQAGAKQWARDGEQYQLCVQRVNDFITWFK